MNGWIFLNAHGEKLAKGKYWYDDEGYTGWVFSDQEKDAILAECENWKIMPVSYCAVVLSKDFKTVTLDGEPVRV